MTCLVNVLRQSILIIAITCAATDAVAAQEVASIVSEVIQSTCMECHNRDASESRLDLSSLPFELNDRANRLQWIRILDRVQHREMPPPPDDLPLDQRDALVKSLNISLHDADTKDVEQSGRGPMRRLTRDEYQQNLRDVLDLPKLDIRDLLPEDREAWHFNKTAEVLDISRVQLAAYLDAAEVALQQAIGMGNEPPPMTKHRAIGRNLFAETSTFGNREAMFFARDNKALDDKLLAESPNDETIELALFRSAHWPYYGYPREFVARLPGEYRLRFSARAVLQVPGFELRTATQPVPMTFRARKPSGPDVSGDVRATGGLIDIQPDAAEYETTVDLRTGETFEYSLLGLPVPLARNVEGGPPTYRYPPLPEGGQPGVAFRWLEIEGPLSPDAWPSKSHRVLFDELSESELRAASDAQSETGQKDGQGGLHIENAKRLLRRFISRVAREPVSDEALQPFERLVINRLETGAAMSESLMAGYKAFLSASHFLFLPEPKGPDDHFAVASRLSHFLTNTRPDLQLMERAIQHQLGNADVLRAETDRLIQDHGFDRFVRNFTDYWLNLRHINRDEPDVRLHPEYRFDAYLVESMERETREFFRAMVRENLPVSVLIDSDVVYINDRLARHYDLPSISGSAIRKVDLPAESPYGGLLTQAAILKVTANGTTTSPVIRGAWIMDRILGHAPPPPPASVPAVEPDIRGAKTIRDLLALHTKSETCAGCHAFFDPVGLALENFDVLGGWRTRYRGLEDGEKITGIDRAGHDFVYTLSSPVDATGKLLDGRSFRDMQELKQLLLADPRGLARNLLHQFTVYATGTPVRFSDRAEIERILDTCAATDYRTCDLLHGLIQSRIFLGTEDAR